MEHVCETETERREQIRKIRSALAEFNTTKEFIEIGRSRFVKLGSDKNVDYVEERNGRDSRFVIFTNNPKTKDLDQITLYSRTKSNPGSSQFIGLWNGTSPVQKFDGSTVNLL